MVREIIKSTPKGLMALNKNNNRQIQKGNGRALVHFGKSEPLIR
jgi:hypothetical protein